MVLFVCIGSSGTRLQPGSGTERADGLMWGGASSAVASKVCYTVGSHELLALAQPDAVRCWLCYLRPRKQSTAATLSCPNECRGCHVMSLMTDLQCLYGGVFATLSDRGVIDVVNQVRPDASQVVLPASTLRCLDLSGCTMLRQLSVSARIDAPWLHALRLPPSLQVVGSSWTSCIVEPFMVVY